MKKISTKRKKEIYSLSSLLLHVIIFIGLLLSLGTDSEENRSPEGKKQPAEQQGIAPLDGLFAFLKR